MTIVKKLRKNNLYSSISKLFYSESPIIMFIREDGSKLKQNINKEFLYHDNGRRRSNYEIKNDLLALKNDYNAIKFKI